MLDGLLFTSIDIAYIASSPADRETERPADRPVHQPASHAVRPPAGRPAVQSAIQPDIHPVSCSRCFYGPLWTMVRQPDTTLLLALV